MVMVSNPLKLSRLIKKDSCGKSMGNHYCNREYVKFSLTVDLFSL